MLALDNELIRLGKEYKKLTNEHDQLESEISDLLLDQGDIEARMDRIEAQMDMIKKKMTEKKIYEINKLTDDPFTNDFIRASYFALKEDDGHRQHFQYINITETELQACDTHRLVIIKCPHIPDELKNTKIRWDVREDFKEHIETDVEFPDVHKVIPPKDNAKLFPGVNPKDFYSTFKPAPHNDHCVIIDFDGVDIGINKEYLDEALMVLAGEFDLYIRGELEPLTLEGKDITVILLPVRLAR